MSISVFPSLTTCWKFPGKLEQTLDVLNSLPKSLAPILVVNEYPPPENFGVIKTIFEREYPQHTLLQKDDTAIGQAASLNIILRKLQESGKRYWLHMEESWYLDPRVLFSDKFSIDELVHIMDTSPIAQLQLTAHWRDLPENVYVDKEKDYVHRHELLIVPPPKVLGELVADGHQMYSQADNRGLPLGAIWPQFSLLPGLTRADTITHLTFPEDMSLWPVKFEFELAVHWARGIKERGLYKATFEKRPFFIRRPGHVSTYDQ